LKEGRLLFYYYHLAGGPSMLLRFYNWPSCTKGYSLLS